MRDDLTDVQHAELIRKLISDLGYAIADAQKAGLTVQVIASSDHEPIGAKIWRVL